MLVRRRVYGLERAFFARIMDRGLTYTVNPFIGLLPFESVQRIPPMCWSLEDSWGSSGVQDLDGYSAALAALPREIHDGFATATELPLDRVAIDCWNATDVRRLDRSEQPAIRNGGIAHAAL